VGVVKSERCVGIRESPEPIPAPYGIARSPGRPTPTLNPSPQGGGKDAVRSLRRAVRRTGWSEDRPHQLRQIRHSLQDNQRPCFAQPIGMARPAMPAACKADHLHSGGNRARHPGGGILDHQAVLWMRAHPLRRVQEKVRRRFASLDLHRAEHIGEEIVESRDSQ
jgi:hypothetical protein